MFNIPNFHKMEMTFEEAKGVLTINDSLIDGMEHVDAMWEKHCADDTIYEDDDDFYEHWAHAALGAGRRRFLLILSYVDYILMIFTSIGLTLPSGLAAGAFFLECCVCLRQECYC